MRPLLVYGCARVIDVPDMTAPFTYPYMLLMLVKEWSISLIHGLGMYSSCEPMYRRSGDVMNDGIDAHLCGPATAILPQPHESCDRLWHCGGDDDGDAGDGDGRRTLHVQVSFVTSGGREEEKAGKGGEQQVGAERDARRNSCCVSGSSFPAGGRQATTVALQLLSVHELIMLLGREQGMI